MPHYQIEITTLPPSPHLPGSIMMFGLESTSKQLAELRAFDVIDRMPISGIKITEIKPRSGRPAYGA